MAFQIIAFWPQIKSSGAAEMRTNSDVTDTETQQAHILKRLSPFPDTGGAPNLQPRFPLSFLHHADVYKFSLAAVYFYPDKDK